MQTDSLFEDQFLSKQGHRYMSGAQLPRAFSFVQWCLLVLIGQDFGNRDTHGVFLINMC